MVDFILITISILTLIATAIGVYIAYIERYKPINKPKIGRKKCKIKTCNNNESLHNKSNRKSLRKITIAFIIEVIKK